MTTEIVRALRARPPAPTASEMFHANIKKGSLNVETSGGIMHVSAGMADLAVVPANSVYGHVSAKAKSTKATDSTPTRRPSQLVVKAPDEQISEYPRRRAMSARRASEYTPVRDSKSKTPLVITHENVTALAKMSKAKDSSSETCTARRNRSGSAPPAVARVLGIAEKGDASQRRKSVVFKNDGRPPSVLAATDRAPAEQRLSKYEIKSNYQK
ncbi:uncharacterized protein SPPG_02749 [Spizellomyces punctatus DAOM BR117]|uniref:Uncharacterized protein n=1 Tax=Spizellomyces punctatus (strain DAOM BR117) TaxID=645134 RepID=A0A0L0HLG1_SPIPD|nr:uncharacterized protein SPPG_02749 [Spizellomyces punctatus DAOM BR117]KND02271.1 hypothetical protein SPPG_02749 [Spizellomyces punctatus DAOM BR117]|eukprot:XP_016610310.1 hypothetical protein SPPG_02749 [Spizellomyces punctatus DAOM BR117]